MKGIAGWMALLGAALASAPARAQETLTLVPQSHSVDGELVLFAEGRGVGPARRAPWPTGRIEWLFVRAAGTQRNLDELPPARPGGGFARLALEHPGTTLVGLDARPRVEVLSAGRLADFALDRMERARIPAELAELEDEVRDEPVRVRRIECAKTLVRAAGGPPSTSSATALSKSGQAVEIRLLMDPTRTPAGLDLPVRVYLPFGGAEGTRVLARHLGSGRTRSATCDRAGIASVHLAEPGRWSLEVHALRRLPSAEGAHQAARWELASGSLSFEVPSRESRR